MIYRFGDYSLDDERLELRLNGQAVTVEPQVFSLIEYLIKNRDQVVSKDEIVGAVWDGRAISDAALNSRINLARRAVGDNGKAQALIKTFPRRGFRFVMEVREQEHAVDALPSVSAAADKPSIAVLAFTNLSGESDQDYFSDGVAEDIITALSHIRWLLVVSRNSSFSYKGQESDFRQISSELGVRYLVSGSVRKSGARVRINSQLVDGETGNQMWAEKFDRELADIFDIQDEITGMVMGAIEPEMQRAESDRALQKRPEELDAWDLNQRGVWHMWKRDRETTETALDYLLQAVEIDPGLARAYGNLSNCYRVKYVYGWADDLEATRQNCLDAAKMAIEADAHDSWGHAQLGTVYALLGEFELGRMESEIALRQNPNSAMAYFALANCLCYSGELEAAIEPLETAFVLSPNDFIQQSIMTRRAEVHLYLHELEAAIEWAQRASRIPPVSWNVYAVHAAALGHLGRLDEAKLALEKTLEAKSDFTAAFMCRVRKGAEPELLDYFIEGLQKAGLPES